MWVKNRFSDVMGEWVAERYSWRPTWAVVGRGCGGRGGENKALSDGEGGGGGGGRVRVH